MINYAPNLFTRKHPPLLSVIAYIFMAISVLVFAGIIADPFTPGW